MYKSTQYRVLYSNGAKAVFSALSFTECIILAKAAAISEGKNPSIDKIYDEYDQLIEDVKDPTYKISAVWHK